MPANVGGCLIDPSIDAALDSALSRIATLTPLIVAADYDGTLAPIVDDPKEAHPDPRTLGAFRRVARDHRTQAVIVSGRSLEALARFVGSDPDVVLIGNHGSTMVGRAKDDHLNALINDMVDLSEQHPGSKVESKPTGAAFHYRHTVDPVAAQEAARAVAGSAGATVIEGKKVVEAVLGIGDKGTALSELRATVGARAVLFIGDDVTDEAAFAILGDDDIGIKVGSGVTEARYRVDDVSAVAVVFDTLWEYLHGQR